MKPILCEISKCTGCCACKNICPSGALSMTQDNKGFYRPLINEMKCVECNLCVTVCNYSNINSKSLESILHSTFRIYGLKNNNPQIRKNSSSGGTFFLLAEEIIAEKGTVYGCILNADIEAVLTRSETIEGCVPMMGSKYVQANPDEIYRSVEEDLKNSRKVLFTGSPCQCAALRKYLNVRKVSQTNLLVVEFLCHGGPSPKIFEGYKQRVEEKYNGKIVKFYFRDKEKVVNPPSSRGMRAFLQGNASLPAGECETLIDVYDENLNNQYFELFKRNYISQDSCYQCQFVGFEKRAGDIAIADYWGCENYHQDFFDKDGISLVLISTEKGLLKFQKICSKASVIDVEKDECLQAPLIKAPAKPKDFDKFWDYYYRNGYTKAVNKFSRFYIIEGKYHSFKGKIKKFLMEMNLLH